MPLRSIGRASQDAPRQTVVGWPGGLALVASLVAVLFFWGWSRGSDARTLARMPPQERARLFQLTRGEAEALCADPDLEDRCRAEVDLLAKFPECDPECRTFVARHQPPASR